MLNCWESRIQGKWKWEQELPTEMPDEGLPARTHIRFYRMMVLCNVVGPFHIVGLKFCNREVNMH